jgi:hypothetical protein
MALPIVSILRHAGAMTTTTPNQLSTGRRTSTLLRIAAIGALALGALALTSESLDATTGQCGEYSYGFTGTRLINDGISTSAGPFAIALPAGTYDIEMWSNDNHPTPDYQTDQIEEQWYFMLDNGYVSPVTLDVPNDQQAIVTSVGEVTLDAATAISVHHRLVGTSPNSVNVECVGFTPVEVEISPPVSPSTTEPQILPPPSTPTTEPTTVVTTIPTEVKSEVVTPPIAQLAVTGNDGALTQLGLLLVLVGVALVAADRRLSAHRNSQLSTETPL